MKILQNAGSYEILAHTPDAIKLIERAGRTCYKSENKITRDSSDKFIRGLIKSGHHSVIEHASMTVVFRDHSRGFTHQLVRHRLTSPSQESTRYVDESDLHFVMPPDKDPDTLIGLPPSFGALEMISLRQYVQIMQDVYAQLLGLKWKKEDARQFLPIGTTNEIVISANFREWMHIFRMRCERHAHWEIRRTMVKLLLDCTTRWPAVFDHFECKGIGSKDVPHYESPIF